MSAVGGRGRTAKALRRLIAGLAAVLLATSCTVYKIKELDGKALAAKGRRGTIISVQTADDTTAFSPSDPPAVKNGAVVGNVHLTYTLDRNSIADVAVGASGTKVVLKDGSRFRVGAAWAAGNSVRCEAVKSKWIPLADVTKAQVRSVKGAASVLKSIAGVALFVGILAIEAVIPGDDYNDDPFTAEAELTAEVLDSWFKSDPGTSVEIGHRGASVELPGVGGSYDLAGETGFWTLEWTPVAAAPDEGGKLRLGLGNPSGVARGVDEVKLVVVDHAPGVVVAPDVLEGIRTCSGAVAADEAMDKNGMDVRELVAVRDGVFWRTAADGSAPGVPLPRDEITLSFPRPKGARQAKLVVSAANSDWRALFAREVKARTASQTPPSAGSGDAKSAKPGAKNKVRKQLSGYEEWEYSRVRVRLLTAFGWQTGQAIFAGGPLPAADMIYNLYLDDVGADKVWLKLTPPAGYWLIDRLAVDFGADEPVERTDVGAGEVDGPDAAEVLRALAVEDGTTFLIGPGDPPALLTFTLPPPKAGLERTLLLRTVSCYEMPPGRQDK